MTDVKLIQKIALAALDVGGKLKADKTNKDQGYNYISADKMLSECGQALFKQGISIIPSIVKRDIVIVQRENNKVRYDCVIDYVFRVTDGVETIEAFWFGMGSDYTVPDKALYKAMTSGHKYFVSKLLCIGEGNEDSENEEQPAPKPAQKSQPAPKPTPTRLAVFDEIDGKPIMGIVPANGNGHAPITLAEAENITNSEGLRYGDIETAKLAHMVNALGKMSRRTPEQESKMLAIPIILKARDQAQEQPAQ